MGSKPFDHPEVMYTDVVAALREVEKTHCCDCRIVLTHPTTEGTPVLLWVRVEATPRIVGRRTIRNPASVSHRYPCVDSRTVEGLLLRLVYKLDHDLDEVGHCGAEQATFPWDEGK
jgi:hypothetical protein